MGGESDSNRAYWKRNVRLLLVLLAVWFVAGPGLGILFVEQLNRFHIGGFPLGFWFAQQGCIWIFILIIFVYARTMARYDRELDDEKGSES
ncbi:MAG: DUF4212 domain-containing protein [Lentisphaerae bacterium]|nr:DUF4212 domain-containing protein [Lentisphaerota bacterium]